MVSAVTWMGFVFYLLAYELDSCCGSKHAWEQLTQATCISSAGTAERYAARSQIIFLCVPCLMQNKLTSVFQSSFPFLLARFKTRRN
jgi:hypothetical protein